MIVQGHHGSRRLLCRLSRALPWVVGLILFPLQGIGLAPDQADYRYAHGFKATGDFSGACDAVGFHLRTDDRELLTFSSEGGTLMVFEIRENRTILNPDGEPGYALQDLPYQTIHAFDIPPGEIQIQVHPGSHLHGKVPTRNGTLPRAHFHGLQWESGPVSANQSYGPNYAVIVGNALIHGMGYVDQGWNGLSRALSTPGQWADFEGVFQMRMDNVDIVTPEGVHNLPPYLQAENPKDLRPVAWHDTRLFTYAVLNLTQARATLSAESVEILCKDLVWNGTGTVTFRNAHGQLSTPQGPLSFERKEFTLSGTLEFREYLEEHEVGGIHQGWARGTAEGSFDAVGLDFTRAATASVLVLSPGQMGLLAAIAAALAGLVSQSGRLVGFFFSRFDPTSAPRHPSRAMVLTLVNAHPGISLAELHKMTGFNKSTLRHHLRVLQIVGLLKFLKSRQHLHLYPKDYSLAQAQKTLPLDADPPVRFLLERAQEGGLERRRANQELMTRFGMTRVGAWKVIRRGLALGVLRAEPSPSGEVLHRGAASSLLPAP